MHGRPRVQTAANDLSRVEHVAGSGAVRSPCVVGIPIRAATTITAMAIVETVRAASRHRCSAASIALAPSPSRIWCAACSTFCAAPRACFESWQCLLERLGSDRCSQAAPSIELVRLAPRDLSHPATLLTTGALTRHHLHPASSRRYRDVDRGGAAERLHEARDKYPDPPSRAPRIRRCRHHTGLAADLHRLLRICGVRTVRQPITRHRS